MVSIVIMNHRRVRASLTSSLWRNEVVPPVYMPELFPPTTAQGLYKRCRALSCDNPAAMSA